MKIVTSINFYPPKNESIFLDIKIISQDRKSVNESILIFYQSKRITALNKIFIIYIKIKRASRKGYSLAYNFYNKS